jgi:uncharacterized protein YlxW (UPF0749 family)
MIMRAKNRTILYLLGFLILGTLISAQVRATRNVQPKISIQMKTEDMQRLLDSERLLNESLEGVLKEELALREKYLKAIEDGRDNKLLEEWKEARFLAGFTGVKGEGVIINISDAQVRDGKDLNSLVVHDRDLIRILNDLKIAGAQAISLNGERILSTSELVCTGPTVQINRNRYPAPYEIRAVGNKERLYAFLNDSPLVKELKSLNFGVEIKRVNDVSVKRFSGDITRVVRGLEEHIS